MYFFKKSSRVGLIYKDRKYTYNEILRNAKGFSKFLNIEKEDRVAIFMENRAEYIFAFLGTWIKKGTCTNLDSGYNEEQLTYVFNDSEPKYIFVSNETKNVAERAREISGKNIQVINVDEITEEFKEEIEGIEELDRDQVAVMLYTSGTTGNPKGVMLTYDNLMSNVEAIKEIKVVEEEKDSVLAMLPFHHIFPLSLTILMPLYLGCFIVILEELSSESIKRNLQKYKASVLMGVPRIWEMFHKGIMGQIKNNKLANFLFEMCKKINNQKLSKMLFNKVQETLGGNVKYIVSGGAKLEAAIADDFRVLGFTVLEGYGLTETSPIIAFNRPNNVVSGTVGEVIPDVEVKIEKDGEIVVKGRNVMKGYYNKPEATKEAIDEEGWFHTGDLGEFVDGNLKIIGRKKEMIVLSNGKNINPSDVENEIMKATDLLQEIAVTEYNKHLVAIAYPDFKKLQERKISNAKEAIKWEVIDKYNVTAPKYRKILDIVIVKEELPKTKLGKIRRFLLKDILEGKVVNGEEKKDKKVSTSSEINSKEFKVVSEFIKKLKGEDENIIPESHLEIDLGLDSLDLVELITFLENTFGIKAEEEDFAKIKTVEELCVFIREKEGVFEKKDINWQMIFSEPVELKMPTSKYVILFKKILKLFFTKYIKLEKKVDKLENNSPVIFVGNHQSMLDAFAFGQLIPNEMLKNTYFMAINIHFEGKIKKYFANNGNIILLDINKNLKETLKIAAKVLKDGKNLVIFPEGARTRDGEIQEFKKTFAILSKELNVPVVPFVIKGAYELMPYGKSFPSSGPMEIEILDKIVPENKSIEEIQKEVFDKISEELKK